MEIRDAIKIALPIFAENKNSEWDFLYESLDKSNIPQKLIDRLLEFMPLAYGRVFLDGMGVKFEDYYVRYNPETKQEMRENLADNIVFKECLESAKNIVVTKSEVFTTVALRSAEVSVVNDALKAGSNPVDLVLAPPYLQWLDETSSDKYISKNTSENNKNPKSWWKFWK